METKYFLDETELSAHKLELLEYLLEEEGVELEKTQTILPRENPHELPLSFAQQRLWFLDQLQPHSPFYNIPTAIRLQGHLNVSALSQSLNEIISRHEALRTTFPTVEGQPIQVITSALSLNLPVVELSELPPEAAQQAEAQRLITQEARQPFDLSCGPLLRTTLLRLSSSEHILLLTMHHIVSDGWSMGVFMQELAALYLAFSSGTPSPLQPLPIQYVDFALWQQGLLQGEVLETQLAYWKQQLGGSLPLLELPLLRPRPFVQTNRGAKQSLVLPLTLTSSLKTLSQQEGVTLYMTLLAAFNTLLSRYSGQSDILVGSPIANRKEVELEQLIGCFVNTLVMRTDLSGNPTFLELLAQVREVALGAYAHQDVPFEKLVEELQPERDLSRSPLFQVMFALQNAPMPALEMALTLERVDIHNGTSKFDLILSMHDTEQGLVGVWEYNTDLFDSTTITRMAGHFQILLEGIVANPQERVSHLPLLSADEQQTLLVEWNQTQTNYPQHVCVHQLFEATVEHNPDAIAVVYETLPLTYRELNQRANQLAHYLQSLGVAPGVLVGLCIERSLEMVVAMVGILKAGGAYVPLDPAYPKERLSLMLADAQVSVLLTQPGLTSGLDLNPEVKLVELSDWEVIAQQSQENPLSEVKPHNIAYVIYTSGSTGKPKGVAVPHQAINRLVCNTNYITLTAADVVAQVSNCSFDAATFEIWGALVNGARLVGISKDVALSPQDFALQIQQQKISTLLLTTALFNQIANAVPSAFQSVKHVLFGGEAADPKSVKEVLKHNPPKRLLNAYGPTESTTFATYYQVQAVAEEATKIPIGRPLANTQLYILDRHLQPVPVGIPGELFIGGDGLAWGYLNRPELTNEKFIPNPFSQEPGARLYRTGDLVRYLPDGNVEFLGRIDHQVKIRGFRIELGEVEATLSQHPAVRESIVLAQEDQPGNKRLVAYVAPKQNQLLTTSDLRSFLNEKLPSYMVPSAFVIMESLPLTPNGKVDRRALPTQQASGHELEKNFVAPQDPLELQLMKIWAEVLGIQSVGVRDNFFELGGHSLLAVRLFAHIEKAFGKKLPLATLFAAPTISQLANILRSSGCNEPIESLVPLSLGGDKPPLFCIYGILLYYDLARNLDSDQPVYGVYLQDEVDLVQAGKLEKELSALTDVSELASRYLKEIRTLQPKGPYFLAGESFGGLVAFEMAQQLHMQGEKVDLLALFDTQSPGRINKLSWREHVSLHWQNLLQEGYTYALKKVRRIISSSKDRLLSMIVRRIYKKFERLPNDLTEVAQRDVRKQVIYQAMRNYVARPYPGKMILFRAKDRDQFEARETDPQFGWGDLAAGGLEVHHVPGDHIGILKEPHVQVMATKLKACLEQAQADDGAAQK